jgi:hypothetical protein
MLLRTCSRPWLQLFRYGVSTSSSCRRWHKGVLHWLMTFKVKVMLRPTVSWPVCLDVKPHWGPRRDFCYCKTVARCWCGAHSLMGGRVCRLQFLLTLTSAVIFTAVKISSTSHLYLQIYMLTFYIVSFLCMLPILLLMIYQRSGFVEEHKSWSSLLHKFIHFPLRSTYSLLYFPLQPLNQRPFLTMRDQVPVPRMSPTN